MINSTIKYCELIDFLQNLHLLINNIKDRSGILSYQIIFFLQLGQDDRPVITLLFFGKRYIQTLAKLPQIRPKKKNAKEYTN